MEMNELTEMIIGCAYRVHNVLGPGFLEKVYENALRLELEEAGLMVRQQALILVYYKGHVVGEYYADVIVEDRVILELKAVQTLAKEHEVQLVHYLTATNIENGLLINFGASVQIKRKYKTYRPASKPQD